MNKKRILLVDDEAGFTRLLRLILPNFEVCEENDSMKALATAREFRPDLIFLDVVMPDNDGGTIASEIRADPLLSRTPIVFLTAVVSPKEVTGQGNIGGFPFLAKPVTKSNLLDCIHRHLSNELSSSIRNETQPFGSTSETTSAPRSTPQKYS